MKADDNEHAVEFTCPCGRTHRVVALRERPDDEPPSRAIQTITVQGVPALSQPSFTVSHSSAQSQTIASGGWT